MRTGRKLLAVAVAVLLVVANLASASRRIGDVESADFTVEVAADQAATDHLQNDLVRCLLLLLAALVAGLGPHTWLMIDMRAAVLRSRVVLASERAELELLRAGAHRERVPH